MDRDADFLGSVNTLSDFLLHFITPYLVLTLAFIPDNVRYVRSSTITQYSEDYVMVQKAFGASKAEIMFKHVCKNVLLPVITKLGMALPTLVTGAVITETVFSWPGIGAGYGLSDCYDRSDIVFHPGSPGKPAVRYFILRDRSAYQKDGVIVWQ